MRKSTLFLLLFFIIGVGRACSQKIYNRWYFGYHAGLDFNTSPPTPLSTDLVEPVEPPYYTSTICDRAGNLLFFTDGLKVWNTSMTQIPKYMGRWPWRLTANVMPLACPVPGNDSLYYLFTVGKANGIEPNGGKLISLTINMAANFGDGKIVYPQPSTADNFYTVHTSNASFVLAGTAHCNQKDTWIVTVANGALESFLVTSDEASTTPIRTPLAIPQSLLNAGYSNIKFSANGEKIVIPGIAGNKILVYDFNNLTGVFSNPVLITLPEGEILSDVELSPAGSKLYYGCYSMETDGPDVTGVELHNVYQLDLDAGSATDVWSSRHQMNPFPDRGGCPRSCFLIRRTLQLGPDGKIYISLRDLGDIPLDKTLNVIEYPEQKGDDAQFRRNFINVGVIYKFINVSYIRSGSFSSRENGIISRKKICFGLPTDFSLLYTRIDSVKWDFGEPASGTTNYSTALQPSHNYGATGMYTVRAIIYKNCGVDTAISNISIDPDPIVRIPAHVKDTVVCIGNTLKIDAGTPAATSYQWNDGLIYSFREVDKPENLIVRAFNTCSSDQKKFTVSFAECPCEVFIPSAFTPNNDGKNDFFKPLTSCVAKEYQFKIFNRYGNVVFYTKDVSKGWDGTYKGLIAGTAVYVWTLQYKNPNSGELIRKKGTVTVIR
jgi:gliding motility-associated-like protein